VFSFFQDYSQPRRNIQSYKTFLRRVCPESRKYQIFCFVFTLIFYVTTLKLHFPCNVQRWKISNHIFVLGRMWMEMVVTYLQSSFWMWTNKCPYRGDHVQRTSANYNPYTDLDKPFGFQEVSVPVSSQLAHEFGTIVSPTQWRHPSCTAWFQA